MTVRFLMHFTLVKVNRSLGLKLCLVRLSVMFLQDFCWLLMGIPILAGSGSACEYSPGICEAWADGDIRIGVLNSCHSKVQTLPIRERPEKYNCTEWVFCYMLLCLYSMYSNLCLCVCVTMQPRRLWVLFFSFKCIFYLLEWDN